MSESNTGATMPRDIHEYLAEFDDIPGTRVFTAKRARQGYHINQFAMSLMKAENRERFKADERAYLDEWPMTEAAKLAVLARDYNAMIDEGGNIYFLSKLFSTDGKSFQFAAGSMTGMTQDEYAQMMINGGRAAAGVRSIKGGY
jgi:protocatechuate 4,5-dioxygenase alpha chain